MTEVPTSAIKMADELTLDLGKAERQLEMARAALTRLCAAFTGFRPFPPEVEPFAAALVTEAETALAQTSRANR